MVCDYIVLRISDSPTHNFTRYSGQLLNIVRSYSFVPSHTHFYHVLSRFKELWTLKIWIPDMSSKLLQVIWRADSATISSRCPGAHADGILILTSIPISKPTLFTVKYFSRYCLLILTCSSAHTRLDCPTFEDSAVQRQLEEHQGAFGFSSAAWEGLIGAITTLQSVLQVVTQFSVLVNLLRQQKDGILFALLTTIPIMIQYSGVNTSISQGADHYISEQNAILRSIHIQRMPPCAATRILFVCTVFEICPHNHSTGKNSLPVTLGHTSTNVLYPFYIHTLG